MKLELRDIAKMIMFSQGLTKEDFLDKIKGQWEFRKNKTVSDLNSSVKKGFKAGMGKTETEIDMVELYLRDVLKRVKANRQ